MGSPRGYAASAEVSAGFAVCSVDTNRKNRRGQQLICRQPLLIISCPHPSQTLRIFRWGRGRGRSCCRLPSATVATIATVVLAVSDLPSQPSQPSRGLFAFSIIGQRDTSPFVPNLVLIADVVFIQQSARLHIQILAQRICRHADVNGIGKLGGRACPYRLADSNLATASRT